MTALNQPNLDARATRSPVLGRIRIEPPMVLHARVVAGAGGGPDKTILRSPRHCDPDRLRMAAAYIHPHNDAGIGVIREQARQLGCPLHTVAETGPLDPRTVRTTLALCRRLNVAVWHGHDYKSNALGLLISRFHPMRLVTTVHGWTDDTVRARLYKRVDQLCLTRYEHVVAVSRSLYDHCLSHGVEKRRLWLVHNAIDLDEYSREYDTDTARMQLGVSRDSFALGVIARFSPEKGVDRAVRMFAKLHKRYPRAELHLIGDGPGYASLSTLARELGVAEAVRFWGWQSHTRRFLEFIDALLIPSYTEGLPNVALEAMAMGVPVAATDVGGVRELLQDGRCGVLLDRDESTWARQVAPLVVSADRRAELARRARGRIERHYSFANRMQRMMRMYDRVLRVRSRRVAA